MALACARWTSCRCVVLHTIFLALFFSVLQAGAITSAEERLPLRSLPGEKLRLVLAGIPVTNTSWRHGSALNLF